MLLTQSRQGGTLDIERPNASVTTVRASPRESSASIDAMVLGYETRVVNFCQKELQVCLRSGINYSVAPKNGPPGQSPGVIIQLITESHKDYVKIDSKSQLNEPHNEDQKILKASLKRSNKLRNEFDEAIVEYYISREHIDSEGGVIYLPELDIQLSILSSIATPEHPFSSKGCETHIVYDNDYLGSQILTGLAFKLVDNSGQMGVRYLNLNRSVYQLTPVSDMNLNSGLWVTTNGMCSGSRRHAMAKTHYYPLDKVDELFGKLYKTAEEARIDGDPDIISKREHERAESELKADTLRLKQQILESEKELAEIQRVRDLDKQNLVKLQGELDRTKLAFDQKEQEYKAHERNLEHQRKILENELQMYKMHRGDYYEERSQSRKDSSEMMKMLPIIVTSISTILSLVALMNSNKK